MARHTRATSTKTPTSKRFLTPQELSDMTAIPVRTLKAWRASGEGPKFVHMGRMVRYPAAEVEAYCADPEGYQRKRDMEVNI